MEYYIYTLTDPISLEIKYIGKTKNIKDRLQRHMLPSNLTALWQPKTKWLKYLKNNNLKPIIELLDVGDENNIDELEVYWISQFKTWGYKLKNIAKGGSNPNPKGEKLRKNHIDTLKKSCKNKKIVLQYTITNVFVKEYESIKNAEKETGFKHISECCRNIRHNVGGYYFRYKDNYFPYVEKENFWLGKKHKKESVKKMKMNHPFRKVIQQYDINTNELIKEFLSSYDVERELGFCRTHVTRCCKGVKNYNTVGGYYFRYKDNYFPNIKK